MHYNAFRKKRISIGSGIVEEGCRAVFGKRLKQSDMFWTAKGANAIIALRCCIASGRFEESREESA